MQKEYKAPYCPKCDRTFYSDEAYCSQCGYKFGKDDFKMKVTNPDHLSCFVATACYGVDGLITESLRSWRDRQTNVLSCAFIKIYYAGVGRFGAMILKNFPKLKPLARITIKRFIKILKIR